MNHVQTRMNTDGTICLDYYNDELYTSDTADTIRKTTDYIESKVRRKIRRFPFYVTTCEHCRHRIVTNRDYLDEIKCQNCGKEFRALPSTNDTDLVLAKGINDAMSYELKPCTGYVVYMLSFIPEKADPSILNPITQMFGFRAEHCEGEIYDALLQVGVRHGWVTRNCKVGFSKTVLDERDHLFDGTIPRIESCARFITKYSSNQIKTVSMHVNPGEMNVDSGKKNSAQIKQQIEDLIAQGKYEEALKLMENL